MKTLIVSLRSYPALFFQEPAVVSYTLNVLESFRRKTGRPLHPSLTGLEVDKVCERSRLLITAGACLSWPTRLSCLQLAEAAYKGNFVLVSHNTDPDPLFIYANRTAQELWELPWDQFCGMPSRKSAEPSTGIQADRNSALAK